MDLPLHAGVVTLRRPAEADHAALAAEANNIAVWRNMLDGFPHPYTEDEARTWLERCIEQDPPLDLVIAKDDRLVGFCGIRIGEGVSIYTGNVGYWLGESHWGTGIATAMLGRFLDYIWETFEVERLQAEAFAWNPASARVLEKNGFKLEGIRRKAIFKDGRFVDEWFYSLLRSEVQ